MPINWIHVLVTFLVSAFIASFTDWYFFGVLFHDRYMKTPGIWKKYKDKKDEMRSIWISEAVMSVSLLVFVLVCAHTGWTTFSSSIQAALVFWIMIPLPLLVTNAIYIPMDRRIVMSHSLGWLARLLVTACCLSLLL